MKPNFATIKGRRVHYYEVGRPTHDPSILFLHGWALCGKAFEKSLMELGNRYHVIAPDLPGFGQSESLDAYGTYKDYEGIILEFMDKLGLSKVNLIGQSMGGGIALSLASSQPNRVHRIVLANSAAVPMPGVFKIAGNRGWELLNQTLYSGFRRENWDLFASFSRNFNKRLWDMLHTIHLPVREDLRPKLSAIQHPTLLLWAKNDTMIPKESATDMQTTLGNCRLVEIEDGYHEWSLLNPDLFSRHVFEHLKPSH